MTKQGRRVTGVDWISDDGAEQGHIAAEMVVNCAGMWGHEVGKIVAAKAREKGIERVVFDRGGFLYHGVIKAVADGAREVGLEF